MAQDDDLRRLTAQIVTAYLRFNEIPPEEMDGVIRMVHASLAGLTAVPPEPRPPPAVPIRRSISTDSITCLDCGWSGKMIRRHISRSHNLTPDQYRARWGLAPDYPMLSYGYSEMRSALAKRIGLGMRGRGRRPAALDDPPPVGTPPRSRSPRRRS